MQPCKILNGKYEKHDNHLKDESDGHGWKANDVDIRNYNEISYTRMLSKWNDNVIYDITHLNDGYVQQQSWMKQFLAHIKLVRSIYLQKGFEQDIKKAWQACQG